MTTRAICEKIKAFSIFLYHLEHDSSYKNLEEVSLTKILPPVDILYITGLSTANAT